MHDDAEGVALTFWMFHARTVPSVEPLQTVALLLQSSGCWAEFPCRYTSPTTLPDGQGTCQTQRNRMRNIMETFLCIFKICSDAFIFYSM